MAGRIVLATVGTLGDLHPFIAVGRALRSRGHEVCLASMAEYRERIEAAGLGFHPVRPSAAEFMRDAGLDPAALAQRIIDEPRALFGALTFPYLRAAYADLATVIEGASLVLTSSLAFAARLAADALGVARMAIVLQPFMFLSAEDPPRVPSAPGLAPLLRALGPRAAGALLDVLKAHAARGAAPLRAFAAELGVALPRDPLFAGQFSAHGTLALYSPLLGGPGAAGPPRTEILGFASYDGSDGTPGAPQSRALEEFLAAGPPPIVFTLGSFATEAAGHFYETALEVSARLGERAVLVTGETGAVHYAAAASERVRIEAYAPYARVFPRARLIVHHGGIGTVGQALRAGKPQLIVPFLADQPDNASRVARLGAAQCLSPRRFTPSRARAYLSRLLRDATLEQRAAALGAQVAREAGAEAAVRFIEAALGPVLAAQATLPVRERST